MFFYKISGYRRAAYEGPSSGSLNALFFPLKIGGIEIDKNNIGSYNTKSNFILSGNSANTLLRARTSSDLLSTDLYFYNTNTDVTRRYGYPLLYTSQEETTLTYTKAFTKLPSGFISGKYRFRSSIAWASQLNNLRDTTINVNCVINNSLVRAVIFCANTTWHGPAENYTSTSKLFIQTYNNYGEGLSQPTDLFGGYTTDGYNLDADYINMVWDFGDTLQEVPQPFIDWVNSNADIIYSNNYNIKSYNNIEFTSIEEAPPMKRANLSYVGNYKTLILTGTNDKIYVLEWESIIPENNRFGGLSLSAGNGSIYIPASGEDIDINLNVSTTLYESYQIYRPLEDPFTIMLYQNSSEPHRVDKTDFLTEVGGYSGIFRDSANIVNPIIRVQANDIPNFNYVKIGILNRYYFVTDYDIVRTGLIDLYLTEDVLMTYREGIYKLQAFIDRNQYANNPYLVDKKRVIEEGVNVEVHSIENLLMSTTAFNPQNDIRFVLNGYKVDSSDELAT